MEKREKFGSRLGFILISAGCAVGLGGAAFVLLYLFFLVVLAMPIMSMEFSVGRASRQSVATSFRKLEPKGTKWHLFGYFGIAGNYLLMMFYTTIAGWMLYYLFDMARGGFEGLSTTQVEQKFSEITADPVLGICCMLLAVLLGFLVCSLGLKNGVEKITKGMMTALFVVMLVLVVRSMTLPGAADGLSFYLLPDFSKMVENGLWDAVFAAMGQAFFTLSVGIGSMAIFGSYIGKERTLLGETVNITVLDTLVAVTAGLIIFPACAAFGVSPDSGPPLVFVTLPNIFNEMPLSRLWGSLFFLFMSFAALSTVIAVFENILSFAMDYNLLSGVAPFGSGSTIIDLEDFIVSNNLLPLGALVYLLFCVTKKGWGWDNFIKEVNTGKGLRFPTSIRFYVTYVLPVIMLVIFVGGYIVKFFG